MNNKKEMDPIESTFEERNKNDTLPSTDFKFLPEQN